MTDPDEKIPIAFVSYSHDSKEHKRWVAELASKLIENGIDIILDQWDLGLGDDVPKFMENSVAKADRVLMICSEPYVRKADDGKGGVGYEAMIVTGEIVRDLGTSKFIPILRQSPGAFTLPRSVSTRYYIDMSDEKDFDEQFQKLLRELHNIPEVKKPPLGKNPFSADQSDPKITEVNHAAQEILLAPLPSYEDIGKIYRTAMGFARSGDFVGWRKLVRDAKKSLPLNLSKWRSKYANTPLTDEPERVQVAIEGIYVFGPLMSIALAGVESGRDKFSNQVALVDELMFPLGWNPAGRSGIVYMPESTVYVYQGLHGAMSLQTEPLSLALRLACTNVEYRNKTEVHGLWKARNLIGWPESFVAKATVAWDALTTLPQKWTWLYEPFGSDEEFKIGLCAYYMALNILEYVSLLAANLEQILEPNSFHLHVPLCFAVFDDEITRRAYRLLLNNPDQVRAIWTSRNVEESKLLENWDTWMSACASWTGSVYDDWIWRMRSHMPHENLLKEILQT